MLRKLLFAAIFAVILCNCARQTPIRLPETFDSMLFRTEGVHCEDLTYHDYDLIPAPDCHKIYEAWVRGREDYAQKKDPRARTVRMMQSAFLRPALEWYPGKPYPLLRDTPDHPRAYTWIYPYPMIVYSYEETIEHETHHLIGYLLNAAEARTDTTDNGGYSPDAYAGFGYFPAWFIYCHGTPDDPFGIAGKRDSCVAPYTGPINPNL